MSLLAVVQARLGSTRLPGKVLEGLAYPPELNLFMTPTMLEHVLKRAAAVVGAENVVLAVPTRDYGPLSPYWHAVVCGSEDDVLSRFMSVARLCPDVTTFVRFTADCPLLDPGFSRSVIDTHVRNGALITYTSSALDGLDTEVFSRNALEIAHFQALRLDREHVTSWMKRHMPSHEITMPRLDPIRWSVDDLHGLNFVRRVFARCQLCCDGIPHHTNAGSSIGGNDRTLVLDLHEGDGGGLQECTAADILQERVGPEWLYTS